MQTQSNILLIGTHAPQDDELKLILDFLDESVRLAGPNAWQDIWQEMSTIATIFVSDKISDDTIKQINQKITASASHVPVIAYGQDAKAASPLLLQLAMGYLNAPYRYPQVVQWLERSQTATEQQGSTELTTHKAINKLIGSNVAMLHVKEMVAKVAKSDASVLILGESGTGKEVVARTIHLQSARCDKPFIPVNCGAIPGELLESELFGHEKGAFTGAISARKGRFELAQGGTLFLDEIGDMPLAMQVKLLRVLQERSFERVGSNKSIKADVRIIAATHRNLEQAIEEGSFREDLYYRLNVFPIEIPALRNRLDDLTALLEELVTRHTGQGSRKIQFLPAAIALLQQYSWPGNVRELANLVERMTILHPGGLIDVHDLPEKFSSLSTRYGVLASEEDFVNEIAKNVTAPLTTMVSLPVDGLDLKEHLVNLERQLIERALLESNGVVARAADFLKMRRTTLVEKMRKYGMHKLGSQDQLSQ